MSRKRKGGYAVRNKINPAALRRGGWHHRGRCCALEGGCVMSGGLLDYVFEA
jgi:hypothetical protein